MASDLRRLFVALWPERREQVKLHRSSAVLLPKGARAVATANLHLTLRYLGPVAVGQQACVESELAEVAGPAFSLCLDRPGYFERPQVVWIGSAAPPQALFALQQRVEKRLARCGFAPESRPFVPHVTVARKVQRRPRFPPFEAVTWQVRRLALVESLSEPAGVRYRLVRCWHLGFAAERGPSGS